MTEISKERILIIISDNDGTIASCSYNLLDSFNSIPAIETKAVVFHKYESSILGLENCEYFEQGVSNPIRNLFNIPKRIFWLRKIKKQFKPTISISTLTGCSTYNVLTNVGDKKIGIFHSPNTQLANQPISYFLSKIAFKWIYPKLDSLFCVSEEVNRFIKDFYPWIDSKKIQTVYNIHNKDKIKELGELEIEDDCENHIFSNHKVILYCGRLDVNKSPWRLLDSFAFSKLYEKNYHLVFMGPEWNYTKKDVDKRAEDLGIKKNVSFIGLKRNPYKYIKRSSFLVSCSKSEGLPGVLIESLILRRPIVATNASQGIWEILSASEKYDKELKTNFFTNDGIISSNISDEQLNINNLKEALISMADRDEYEPPFNFEQNILKGYVLKKYLNI